MGDQFASIQMAPGAESAQVQEGNQRAIKAFEGVEPVRANDPQLGGPDSIARIANGEVPTEEGAAPVERPAWLPAKFKTPEAMAKAYAELERKQSQPKPKPAPAKPGKGTPNTPAEAPATTTLSPETVQEFTQEFIATGQLSEESYARLQSEYHIDRAFVDQYVAGLQAQAQNALHETYRAAGGEEQYAAMSQWAAANVEKETLDAYNEAMNSGDIGRIQFSVKMMRKLYEGAGKPLPVQVPGQRQEPARRLGGTQSGPQGLPPYESREQLLADQRSARYKADPAFRARVAARLARTN